MIEAEVPNPNGLLLPGAFARAEVVTIAAEPALFVPASSLVTFAGIQKVLTIEDGRVAEKPVQTGRTTDDRIEITAGLEASDQVIIEPGVLAAGQLAVAAQ